MQRAAGSAKHITLTGGIGSGKSTVAALWVDCGAVLVDTDAIARALTAAGGAALPALAAEFGAAIVGSDGALDRQRMRELAFADAQAKARLEAVLHPMIGSEALRQAAAAGTRPVVFDVPLLAARSLWRERAQRVLVVDCSEATQLARVQQRSGWSAEMVQSVIRQQLPRPARRALADAVIHNDGIALAELRAQVHALWALWQGESPATAVP